MNYGSIILSVVFMAVVLMMMPFASIYLRARVAGTPVPFRKILAMWMRRSNAKLLVDCWIVLNKAGLKDEVTLDYLEAHAQVGGHVDQLVLALIAARANGLETTVDEMAAMDLLHPGTVLEHVRALVLAKRAGAGLT